MDKVFLTILNMTFTASVVIAVIIIARLFLKRTPKIISYILWIAVGFRLIFPFSIESVLSIMPVNTQPIPQNIAELAVPSIDTGIPAIDDTVSYVLPVASPTSVNYLQLFITIGTIIWLGGIAVMLTYSGVSMLILNRRLRYAVLLDDNVYEANITTPFVTGVFKPKIYIPPELTDNERDYVILHERTHIKRHDNLIKLFAYFVLSLHWFNPLAWVAFILMTSDMEMSCDENVLQETGTETKQAYSESILSLAMERHTINIYPIAFGGGNTIRRIKNVLNYKKQSKIKIAVTLILAVMLTIGFTFNQVRAESTLNNDFELAADFLANNQQIRVILNSDITTGKDNLMRQDLAYFVARLRNPIFGTKDAFNFFGTEQVSGTVSDAHYDENGKWAGTQGMIDIPDYSTKVYDFSSKYCAENGIINAGWLSESDATVTLQEAVKILVTALQYDDIADNEYLKKAATPEVRLLGSHAVFPFTGVSANKVLTKNDAIMLVYNFMMSDYAVGVDGVAYEVAFMPDTMIDINLETYHNTKAKCFNDTDNYNPNITRDDFIEYLKKQYNVYNGDGLVQRKVVPIIQTSVINTFGAYIAKPIQSKVTVDGTEIAFDAYNIDGSNYFRLRDIAHILNGTAKQFGGIKNNDSFFSDDPIGIKPALNIIMGEPNTYIYYDPKIPCIETVNGSLGYEMPEKGTNIVTASKGTGYIRDGIINADILIYSEEKDKNDLAILDRVEIFGIGVYQINGVTYFKLRDIAEAIDFNVEYDETSDTIMIDTSTSYPNRTPLYTNTK